jgi:hypothetical protein
VLLNLSKNNKVINFLTFPKAAINDAVVYPDKYPGLMRKRARTSKTKDNVGRDNCLLLYGLSG